MLAKIWDQHVIARLSADTDLLHVDRHLLHDLGGSRGLLDIKNRGLEVHNPELTFATPDHAISTAHGRAGTSRIGQELLAALRLETAASGIKMFDVDEPGQGIVHVIGPELGLSLPGSTIVCGDSHTSTHGAFGALAFGIGTSEVEHVLATQTLWQGLRPASFGIEVTGRLAPGLEAKDIVLAIIRKIGTGGATGHAIEYYGSAIKALSMEGRMTICNMSIEAGARAGLIAPDDVTIAYIAEGERPFAPRGAALDAAVADWRTLITDDEGAFDRRITLDAGSLVPQVTWGTNPAMTVDVTGV